MNNHWTEAKEKKLLEWQQQSRLHSLGHGRAQELFYQKNNNMMLPSIVFGAIATLFDGIAVIWTDNYIPFVITALIITACTTILDGIIQATKPISIAAGHADMAKGYNKIILQIDAMLSKETHERDDGSSFITKIEEELITLKTGGIKIPSDVWKGVRNGFLNNELDFQNLKTNFKSKSSFRNTIKMHAQQMAEDISSTESSVDSKENTTIDICGNDVSSGDSELPTFELRIDNDPKTKMMEQMLYDFQMSRF